MAEVPNPAQVVAGMLKIAGECQNTGDMLPVGTFASYYADRIKDQITEENVEAFLQGAAVVNILIQEAVLRVSMAATGSVQEAGSDEERAYAVGTNDGCMAAARLIGETVDSVMKRAAEQPVMDREFHEIVSGLLNN